MPRWPQEIADAVLFDIRYGLNFRVGARSRPATDQEIELVRARSSSVCSRRTGSSSEDHPRRWAARRTYGTKKHD
jgi:hypothetical protein